MVSFDGEVHDVTPARYFEGPLVVKRHGRYFLMNSTGKTTEASYAVEYAVGDTPFGPFIEGPGSPVLSSDPTKRILSPGHHTVFSEAGRDYVLYHRHSIPFDPKFVGRQLCLDDLHFTADGRIEKITPTHAGPALVHGRAAGRVNLAASAVVTASSQRNSHAAPSRVVDDNYATLWAADRSDPWAWLALDLGREEDVSAQELRFEYAWKPCAFTLETSLDGKAWTVLADYAATPVSGSPVLVGQAVRARHLRLTFPPAPGAAAPALFEWLVLR
jgi:hypothetical protein